MDGNRIRKEKVADSKISGYVWTGAQLQVLSHLNKLCKRKATGLDSVSTRLLRESPDLISGSMNRSTLAFSPMNGRVRESCLFL